MGRAKSPASGAPPSRSRSVERSRSADRRAASPSSVSRQKTLAGQIAHVSYDGMNDKIWALLFLITFAGALILGLMQPYSARAREAERSKPVLSPAHIVFAIDVSGGTNETAAWSEVQKAVTDMAAVRKGLSPTSRFSLVYFKGDKAEAVVKAQPSLNGMPSPNWGSSIEDSSRGAPSLFAWFSATPAEESDGFNQLPQFAPALDAVREQFKLAVTQATVPATIQPVLIFISGSDCDPAMGEETQVLYAGPHQLVSSSMPSNKPKSALPPPPLRPTFFQDAIDGKLGIKTYFKKLGASTPKLQTHAIALTSTTEGIGELDSIADQLEGSFYRVESGAKLSAVLLAVAECKYDGDVLPEAGNMDLEVVRYMVSDLPATMFPLLVAVAMVFSFLHLVRAAAPVAVFVVAAGGPLLALAGAVWVVHYSHLLSPEIELALVLLLVVVLGTLGYSLYRSASLAAVSLSLGASVILDMPSLLAMQAALLVPYGMWARFIAAAVLGVDFGGFDKLGQLIAEGWLWHHSSAQKTAARGWFSWGNPTTYPSAKSGRGFFPDLWGTEGLWSDTMIGSLLMYVGSRPEFLLVCHLVLCTGTLIALNAILMSRVSASRYFGFLGKYWRGAWSLFADVSYGAIGTATFSGTIYLAAWLIDQSLRITKRTMQYTVRCIAAVMGLLAALALGVGKAIDKKKGGKKAVMNGTHYVMVLDRSGSMSGLPWADLTSCFAELMQDISDGESGGRDRISVVVFDSVAETVLRECPARGCFLPSHIQPRGGTNYSCALEEALGVLRSGPADLQPALFFLSDGEPTDGKSAYMRSAASVANWDAARDETLPRLLAKPVLFGHSVGGERELREVADALGCGSGHHAAATKFERTVDAQALKVAFLGVAAAAGAVVLGWDPLIIFRMALPVITSATALSIWYCPSVLPLLLRVLLFCWWFAYGLDLAIRYLRKTINAANYLVCVVAGVTGEDFLSSGLRALRLMLRSFSKVLYTSMVMYRITSAASTFLTPVVLSVSYVIMTSTGSYTTDRFLLGGLLAAGFIMLASDSLFTASMATTVCVLEQAEADAHYEPGSPEAMREKGYTELEAMAMLRSASAGRGGDVYSGKKRR